MANKIEYSRYYDDTTRDQKGRDGVWRPRVVGWQWAVTEWGGGFGQVLQSGFKTKREAKRWLEENAAKED